MRLEDLPGYVAELSNLTKFEVKTEDDTVGHLVVTETKETFVFDDEGDADEKIKEATANPQCLAHTKKYKQGKVNKAGEIVRPETWTVVIKLGH